MNSILGQLDMVFWITLAIAAIRTAIPILLAAIGEIFSERSGLLNINIEGQMLFGAFVAFVATYFSGSLFIGSLAGALGGALMALLLGWVCITKLADQTVAGITLNIFALGLTSFWYRVIFGVTTTIPHVPTYTDLQIPLLSKIPILGTIFFSRNIIVYLSVLICILTYVFLFKTPLGLKLRASGEYPRAAETMGVNVFKMRYLGITLCGMLAGLGGAFLTLGILGGFTENVSAGRGFIALAIVIFGNWSPIKALGAAFLFGLAESLQVRLQAIGMRIPYQFLLMVPYVMTVIVMVFTGTRSKAPAALGKPYERESI